MGRYIVLIRLTVLAAVISPFPSRANIHALTPSLYATRVRRIQGDIPGGICQSLVVYYLNDFQRGKLVRRSVSEY